MKDENEDEDKPLFTRSEFVYITVITLAFMALIKVAIAVSEGRCTIL